MGRGEPTMRLEIGGSVVVVIVVRPAVAEVGVVELAVVEVVAVALAVFFGAKAASRFENGVSGGCCW